MFCYFTSSLAWLSLSQKKFQTQSSIHFTSLSPIYRCLTDTNSLLVNPSRRFSLQRFSSQRFVPHYCRFNPSHYLRWLQQHFSPSHHRWCFRRLFAFHPAGNFSPTIQSATLRLLVFFFFFWVNFFVNFCLMILVPLGIFVWWF